MSTSPLTAIKAGSSSTSTVTITPSGGSTGAVALWPAPYHLSHPAQRTLLLARLINRRPSRAPSLSAVTLTIKTSGASSAAVQSPIRKIFAIGGETLAAAVLLFFFPMRRRRWQSLVGILALLSLLTAVSGCGGASTPVSTGGGSSTGTTPGNYTITVTGTSGTTTATAAISFAVRSVSLHSHNR